MINLQTGSNSVWLSLRENLPVGVTPSSFSFTFTNDIRGETYSFTASDLTPNSKWSAFTINIGTPQNLLGPTLSMTPGMYSYSVNNGSTTLDTGKLMVIENKTFVTLDRPAKSTKALKR